MRHTKSCMNLLWFLISLLALVTTDLLALAFSCQNIDPLTYLHLKKECKYWGLKDDGYKLIHQYIDERNAYHYLGLYLGDRQYIRTENSKVINCLHIIVEFHTKDSFRIKIIDDENSRFEIPEQEPFPHFDQSQPLLSANDACCNIEVLDGPMSLVVKKKITNEILFDTRKKPIIYSDKYIEISTKLPSRDVYGFGERSYSFKMPPGTFTIWARDEEAINEIGRGGGNLFSQHPVGLFRGTQSFFVTLMRNSNAMDVVIDAEPSLSYKMIGGIVDLIFFVGDKYPETALRSYYKYLGGFSLVPFWAMGYHQSKFGYSSSRTLSDIVQMFNQNNIPLEGIWSDYEYMQNHEDFTINNWFSPSQLSTIMTTKKWIPVISAGVRSSGLGQQEGLSRDIFVKDSQGKNPWLGGSYRNQVYFPDFFHPKAEGYWKDMLERFYSQVPFSGLWLDTNEPSIMKESEAKNDYSFRNQQTRPGYPESWLPYTPGGRALDYKTLNMDATHSGGFKEYDVHGLYGLMQSKVTYNFLKSKTELPFVISRSTFPGSGKYAAHWTGHIESSWITLQFSLASIFSFQIFGIPFVGADICGTTGEALDDLCARWIQLGAFYPFARNYAEQSKSQEPWAFYGKNLADEVLKTSKAAIQNRYSILKWYYGLFVKARGLDVVFKPLFFEFPEEEPLYLTRGPTEFQFMLGSGVMVTPKLSANDDDVFAYFPKATWFDVFSGEKIIDKERQSRNILIFSQYNTPAPMFLRSGHLLYRQNVANVLSTRDLNNEFELIAALDNASEDNQESFVAHGSIMGVNEYSEKTVYEKCVQKNCLYNIEIRLLKFKGQRLEVVLSLSREEKGKMDLDEIGVYGIKVYGLPLDIEVIKGKNGKWKIGNNQDTEDSIVQIKEVALIGKRGLNIIFEKSIMMGEGKTLVVGLEYCSERMVFYRAIYGLEE